MRCNLEKKNFFLSVCVQSLYFSKTHVCLQLNLFLIFQNFLYKMETFKKMLRAQLFMFHNVILQSKYKLLKFRLKTVRHVRFFFFFFQFQKIYFPLQPSKHFKILRMVDIYEYVEMHHIIFKWHYRRLEEMKMFFRKIYVFIANDFFQLWHSIEEVCFHDYY